MSTRRVLRDSIVVVDDAHNDDNNDVDSMTHPSNGYFLFSFVCLI